MIAVIFEPLPNKEKTDEYLDIAAMLRPELTKIEGFISIERFQSITNPGKILSLSFCENEEYLSQWRNVDLHRMAQEKGNNSIYTNYRIRVAEVIRDYGITERTEAPNDSKVRNKG